MILFGNKEDSAGKKFENIWNLKLYDVSGIK